MTKSKCHNRSNDLGGSENYHEQAEETPYPTQDTTMNEQEQVPVQLYYPNDPRPSTASNEENIPGPPDPHPEPHYREYLPPAEGDMQMMMNVFLNGCHLPVNPVKRK